MNIEAATIDARDFVEANELFQARGWTDGLPIVPPSHELVERMLGGIQREPNEIVAEIAPRNAPATVADIAINAVMAGCIPEYLPVVVAAVEAVADPAFNLLAIQTTTHCCAPLIVVNGPVRECLGMNSATNCFGQGNRANATIGRALRLVLINVGGGIPGLTDKATGGHPGKYTYCLAENEEASPWEPMHVALGYSPQQSTVTVFAAEGPNNVSEHQSNDPEVILTWCADALSKLGSNNLFAAGQVFVALSAEHARVVGNAGWSRTKARDYIFKRAGRPLRDLFFHSAISRKTVEGYRPALAGKSDDTWVPTVERPEDIFLMVAGGEGRHSVVICGWGGHMGNQVVTRVLPDYVNVCHVPA
jgi:hypothetical protein